MVDKAVIPAVIKDRIRNAPVLLDEAVLEKATSHRLFDLVHKSPGNIFYLHIPPTGNFYLMPDDIADAIGLTARPHETTGLSAVMGGSVIFLENLKRDSTFFEISRKSRDTTFITRADTVRSLVFGRGEYKIPRTPEMEQYDALKYRARKIYARDHNNNVFESLSDPAPAGTPPEPA